MPLSPLVALLRTALHGDGNLLSLLPQAAYRMRMGPLGYSRRSILIVNDPALVRQVLADQEGIFPKSDLMVNALEPLIGDAMFVSSGEVWRRQRRMIDPAFSLMRLSRAFGAMDAAVDDYETVLDARADGAEPFSLDMAMSHLTADIICRAVFSTSLQSQTARDVFDAFTLFERNVAQINIWRLIFDPAWTKTPQSPAVLQACALIRRHLGALVDAHVAAGAAPTQDPAGAAPTQDAAGAAPTQDSAGAAPTQDAAGAAPTQDPAGAAHSDDVSGVPAPTARPDDIAAACIAARDGDQAAFTREELIDQLGVLFLAGHETTASALTWAFFILAQQPAMVERMRAEISQICGTGPVEFDHIRQLTFTRNVFRETLRLYPPITFLPRVATQATTLGGKRIRKGALIMIAPWALHRHHDFWAAPDEFDPDRFSAAREAEIQPGTYMPFGAGPRVCVGAGLATTEATLILARLVRRYDIAVRNAGGVRPVARLTTRPAQQILCTLRRAGA